MYFDKFNLEDLIINIVPELTIKEVNIFNR